MILGTFALHALLYFWTRCKEEISMDHGKADPLTIAVVLGSTRPGRNSEAVGRWVLEHAQRRGGAQFELIDIARHDLPMLDEPMPAIHGKYRHPHTREWSATIAPFDGFIFVTPEYNRSVPAALKNAIDYLYEEWTDKAAAFVSYGGDAGGARAVEHLRGIMGEVHVATVRAHVALSIHEDFEDFKTFRPRPKHVTVLDQLLDQVLAWAGGLKAMRDGRDARAAAR
jgi:NAD(P)H-dependent FMN reductase